jgi:hypothetical protein
MAGAQLKKQWDNFTVVLSVATYGSLQQRDLLLGRCELFSSLAASCTSDVELT